MIGKKEERINFGEKTERMCRIDREEEETIRKIKQKDLDKRKVLSREGKKWIKKNLKARRK